MSGLEPLIPIALFLSIAAVLIFRGPLGKGLGERLAGRAADAEDLAAREALRAEVEELKGRLAELEERMDFGERLLAERASRPNLPQ